MLPRRTCLRRSTYKGIVSEDHWDIKRAFPFGYCQTTTKQGKKGSTYMLPNVTQVSKWTRGDELELELTKAKVASSASRASWSSNSWLVSKVIKRRHVAEMSSEFSHVAP